MKYLITGGAGFIGSNFIHYLIKSNSEAQIINLDKLTYCGNLENLTEVADLPNYRFVQGDICDIERVSELIKQVDCVINFAADTHVDRSIKFGGAPFIQTDVYGTYVLLEAIKQSGKDIFFHQVGTDEVYGDIDAPLFAHEEDRLHPSSPYAASKAGGDLQVLAYHRTFGIKTTISRCTNNYGPYQYPEKLIPLFITNALEDLPLPLYDDGKQIRDWLYVDDHCSGIMTIIEKGTPGEIYNIGANQDPEIDNLTITNKILELTKKPDDLIKPVQGIRPGHDQRYAVNTDKIKKLGWKIETSFEEGIEKTIQWYKDHPQWWQKLKNKDFSDYYKKHYQMKLK